MSVYSDDSLSTSRDPDLLGRRTASHVLFSKQSAELSVTVGQMRGAFSELTDRRLQTAATGHESNYCPGHIVDF